MTRYLAVGSGSGQRQLLQRRWKGNPTPLAGGPLPSAREGPRFHEGRPSGSDFRAVRGFPPALGEAQPAVLKASVEEPPARSGIELAN